MRRRRRFSKSFVVRMLFILWLFFFGIFFTGLGREIGRLESTIGEGSIISNASELFSLNLSGTDDEIERELAEECDKGNLIETAECLNSFVKSVYTYTPRKDKEEISHSTLLNEGGDCGKWADFYISLADELNISTKRIRVPVSGNTFHAFAIFFSEEGYCLLDQTRIFCKEYLR